MPQVRWWLYRLKSLWRRDAREADLDAELQFHLEAEAEQHIEAGLPADRARQAALRALGNVALAKEDARAVWTWGAIERVLQDVRYATRVLARRKSFTATAIATILLGGCNRIGTGDETARRRFLAGNGEDCARKLRRVAGLPAVLGSPVLDQRPRRSS